MAGACLCSFYSASEPQFVSIVVKLLGKHVVILGFTSCVLGNAKELRHICVATINLHRLATLPLVTLKDVRVRDRLNLLPRSVHQVVRRAEIALIKGFLRGAVAEEEMSLDALGRILHRLLVFFILFRLENHFVSFWFDLVCCR